MGDDGRSSIVSLHARSNHPDELSYWERAAGSGNTKLVFAVLVPTMTETVRSSAASESDRTVITGSVDFEVRLTSKDLAPSEEKSSRAARRRYA